MTGVRFLELVEFLFVFHLVNTGWGTDKFPYPMGMAEALPQASGGIKRSGVQLTFDPQLTPKFRTRRFKISLQQSRTWRGA
jgi:hypothetical protein